MPVERLGAFFADQIGASEAHGGFRGGIHQNHMREHDHSGLDYPVIILVEHGPIHPARGEFGP